MNHSYKAYQKATHTVSKTRQVVMLYEGILRNLQQAKEAIVQGDVSTRFNKLSRASEIIIGLQMSLDFDSGQDSARTLYDFYSMLDARIMQLHRSQSLEECALIIEEVRQMHELWDKIDRGEIESIATPAASDIEQSPINATAYPTISEESALVKPAMVADETRTIFSA